jgi:N-acylneuraminate cytidylyltransferase/CMP-N,N'-diacetyllegionaminic acid synthase
MTIDALIPARRGSRRLPGKHQRILGGRPLIDWTLHAALEAGIFRRITLSTDDPALREHAQTLGLSHFPLRPASLARDDSSSLAVLRHYLGWLAAEGVALPRWLMLLQPTSPFRGASRMREAWRLARDSGREVVSLGPLEKPLDWCRLVLKGEARPWACVEPVPVWRLNGAVYLVRVERLLAEGSLLSDRPLALTMADWESVDIDTPLDWRLAEAVAADRFPAEPGEPRP